MDNSDSHPEEESFQEGDDEDEMDPEDKDEVEDPPEEDEDDPDFDPEMELDDYPKKTKAHCSICNLDFKTGSIFKSNSVFLLSIFYKMSHFSEFVII